MKIKFYIRTVISCLLLISLVGHAQLTSNINQLNGDVRKIIEYSGNDNIYISHFNQEGFLTSKANIFCDLDICDTSFLFYSYKFDNQGRIIYCRIDESDPAEGAGEERQEWSWDWVIKYYIDSYEEVVNYRISDNVLEDDGTNENSVDNVWKYTMNHILIRESYEGENQSYYCKHTKDGERLLVEDRFVSHPDLNESEGSQIDSLGSLEIPIRPTDATANETYAYSDFTTISVYNSSGLLESIDYTDDKTAYVDVYSYDKNKNLIQVKRNFKDTTIVPAIERFEYVFDKNQNWIKRKSNQVGFDNSMRRPYIPYFYPRYIEERIITYY